MDDKNSITPWFFCDEFDLSIKELSLMCGLTVEELIMPSLHDKTVINNRLLDVHAILKGITYWTGSQSEGIVWYRTSEVPGFCGLSPEDLIKLGLEDEVFREIRRLANAGTA